MRIDEKFIEIKGRKLWTKQFIQDLSDQVDTIVFLHDALGSVAQWKDFPERIAEITGLNVMLYDRFGHGLSDAEPKPPDQSFLDREALVILPEVLHQLKIFDPILYGHSDGGTIALIYAAHIRTKALILEAAHVLVEELTQQGVRETAKNKDYLVPKLEKYHGKKARDLFSYWSGIWSGDLMKDWNIEHILERIDVPTLIMQGEQDNYGSPEQVRKIADGITGSIEILMIEDCGHSPYKDKTEVIVPRIADFISGINLNGQY